MMNPEDHFNESLLSPLNGQQDLQKQSLNMMLDMTHRHEYDNLMMDIPYIIANYGTGRLAATD